MGGSGYWWGENISPQRSRPIRLALPDRLVLSPHTYGHNPGMWYMGAADFPANMPAVWQRGQTAVWAAPQLGSGASSGRAWRLWVARHS